MHTVDQPSSTTGDAGSHFSAVEALFFKEGEEKAADPVEVDNFDDLADANAARHRVARPRRRSAVAISVTCAGILAGVVLWRVETRKNVSAELAAPVPAAAAPALPPAPSPAAAANVPPAPEAAPALPPAPAPPVVANVLPAPEAAPALPPAPAPAVAARIPPVAEAAAAATFATSPSVPAPAASAVAPSPPPAEAPDGDDLRVACKRAVQQHRAKDVLATCGQAFATTPQSADIAVILARTEFDRGRSSQAMTWAKKAVAIDPDASDAYVFIGSAEQNAGHSQPAKAAYQHYLQLAPRGRYAADLRAVLKSL
jgi:tetratricopeptide (TPR) repeat protein